MRWSILLYVVSFLIAVLEVEIGEVEQTFHDTYDVYTIMVDEINIDYTNVDLYNSKCNAGCPSFQFEAILITSIQSSRKCIAQNHPPDAKQRLILLSTFLI